MRNIKNKVTYLHGALESMPKSILKTLIRRNRKQFGINVKENNTMSRLVDKFSVMKNMNRDELKEYLKTMTDNDKDMLLVSFVKMYQSTVENKVFE